jgi:PhnB protein
MVANPPEGTPRITPYLLYVDVARAVDWAVTTCGFTERYRIDGPDGAPMHAEVGYLDGVVMMGAPGDGYRNPSQLGGITQSVHVYVDDVDGHYAHAQSHGANVVREIADQFYGDRTYGLRDPEGHEWVFSQHVRDVAPEDMHP